MSVDPRDLTVVIPTFLSKERWLSVTLDQLEAQDAHSSSVIVLVDRKKTQERRLNPGKRPFKVDVRVTDTISHLKRQHELVDRALRNLETPFFLLQDDDYAFSEPDSLSAMLCHGSEGTIVVPEQFTEVELKKESSFLDSVTLSPSSDRFLAGIEETRTSRGGVPDSAWREYYEPHPGVLRESFRRGETKSCLRFHTLWCGHPKLVAVSDYLGVGGVHYDVFRHYWHCDTDFSLRWSRSGRSVTALRGLEVMHMTHPRGAHQLKRESNEAELDERYPRWREEAFSAQAVTVSKP